MLTDIIRWVIDSFNGMIVAQTCRSAHLEPPFVIVNRKSTIFDADLDRLPKPHLSGTSWATARPTLVSPIRNDKPMDDGGSIAALRLFLLSQQLQSAAAKRKYGPVAGFAATQQLSANRATRCSSEWAAAAVGINSKGIYT